MPYVDSLLKVNDSANSPLTVDEKSLAVRDLKVEKKELHLDGTTFTLSWTAPEANNKANHFNIHAFRSRNNALEPIGSAIAAQSPARIFITISDANVIPIIFKVQTVMNSGRVSKMEQSPSAVASAELRAVNEIVDTPFYLNLNGITTSIDNSTFGGEFTGLKVENNTTHDLTVVNTDFIAIYNTSGNVDVSMARVGDGSGGVIRVFDGTGAGSLGFGQKLILDGNNGKLQCYDIETNSAIGINFAGSSLAGTAGASAGYLTMQVGGNNYKFQAFAV